MLLNDVYQLQPLYVWLQKSYENCTGIQQITLRVILNVELALLALLLHIREVLCSKLGHKFPTLTKIYLGFPHPRPPLCSSGQSSWLQIRRPGFDSRYYQKKK
jgi:hypothetical protein